MMTLFSRIGKKKKIKPSIMVAFPAFIFTRFYSFHRLLQQTVLWHIIYITKQKRHTRAINHFV